MKLLLIEDNPADVRLLAEMLKEAPPGAAELTLASRLDQGLESIRASAPDVVLLDLGLPDSQGLTTLTTAHEAFPTIPIIVLTGLDDQAVANRAVGLGAQDYLVKGHITGDLLLRTSHYAIARQRDRQALQESEARKHAILNALPAHIALLDGDGVILAVNDAWRHFGAANVLRSADACIGQNYLTVCEEAYGDCATDAQAVADGIRAVLRGEAMSFVIEYPCHSPTEQRWFRLMVTPLSEVPGSGAVVMHVNVTERRQAENILRQKEQEQRQLAEQLTAETRRLHESQAVANVGSWETDLASLDVTWTEETFRIFELTPDAFTPSHQGFLRHVHPEDRRRVDETFRRSLDHPGPHTVEHRLLFPDGRIKFVEERWQVHVNAAGQPTRAVGTCQDITARKVADEAIRASEASLVRAQRIAGMGSWEWNIVTDELHWSEQIFELFGIQQEGPGTYDRFLSGVHPEDRDITHQAVIDAVEGRAPYDVKHRVRWPDGTVRVLHELGEVTRDPDGRPLVMTGTAQDITEAVAASEALRTSLAEFRNLAEAMPQIVWVTRADGWHTYFNQHWMDYTGLSLEESLGHGWNRPFHPDDQQRAWDAWQHATATVTTYSLECRLRRADGAYRWWLVRGEPQRDAEGNVQKWFGTCTDIHDRKLAELEIRRTNRALKMLSACNEALIHADDEDALLSLICQIAVADGGYRMAWVGYAQEDANCSIQPVAWAGHEADYLSEIAITWQEGTPEGDGPAGRAIRTGQATISKDFEQDATFLWHDRARRRGYRAVVCLPLRDGSRTFGVLGLYSAEPLKISDEETHLLQEVADGLAFGLGHLRTQRKSAQIQRVVTKVATAVSARTGTEFFEGLTDNMVEALGAFAGFVAEFLPTTPSSARVIAGVVDGKPAASFDYLIAGTPCAQVLSDDECVILDGADSLFPDSVDLASLRARACVGRSLIDVTGQKIGVIFVLFQEPLAESGIVVDTLRLFAGRAASEMERQRADASVREQAALLDQAQDAIFVASLEGGITFWNKSAERLYGWPVEEVLGRSPRTLMYSTPGTFDRAMEKVLAEGEWVGESHHVGKDGRQLVVEGRWTLLRDSGGRPKSILTINTDISERVNLQRQFLRAQRLESIGTLASGVAHDLNNALAPIAMGVELLKDEYPAQSDLLDLVETSTKRAADMVRQLLTFGKGVAGERALLDPAQLVRDLERIMKGSFPKNIEVHTTCDKATPAVMGDVTQLHQVLLNLCVNARDAMPNGGTLTITVERHDVDAVEAGTLPGATPGLYVAVRVRDTGMGMSSEILDQICDPFFSTKGPDKGTGLGLSTVVGIVKGHGGFLHIESQVGHGSTFTVYLPAESRAMDPEQVAEAAEVFCGHGETILLVDDEASVREMARLVLQRLNLRPLTAVDGAEGLVHAAQHQAELGAVITDLHMPHMDGLAFVRALRRSLPAIPVVVASGRMDASVAREFAALGVTHFLDKPFTEAQLAQVLQRVLAPA